MVPNQNFRGRELTPKALVTLDETAPEPASVIAFMLGGMTIAGALLAFVYLDGATLGMGNLAQGDLDLRVERLDDAVTPLRTSPNSPTFD